MINHLDERDLSKIGWLRINSNATLDAPNAEFVKHLLRLRTPKRCGRDDVSAAFVGLKGTESENIMKEMKDALTLDEDKGVVSLAHGRNPKVKVTVEFERGEEVVTLLRKKKAARTLDNVISEVEVVRLADGTELRGLVAASGSMLQGPFEASATVTEAGSNIR